MVGMVQQAINQTLTPIYERQFIKSLKVRFLVIKKHHAVL